MGLTSTTSSETSTMPEPVLHSFSSEREVALKIPPDASDPHFRAIGAYMPPNDAPPTKQ